MKQFSSLLLLLIYGYGSIIHEEPPFFIQDFPIVLDIIVTENENLRKVQAFYKTPLEKEFYISTMDCNFTHCSTTIPAQSQRSFQYFIKINMFSGNIIESEIVTIQMKELPDWQNNIDINNSFINLYGESKNFKGFSLDRTLFIKNKNILIEDEVKASWWNFLLFWQSDEKDSFDVDNIDEVSVKEKIILPEEKSEEKEENESKIEEIQDISNYAEIFTP